MYVKRHVQVPMMYTHTECTVCHGVGVEYVECSGLRIQPCSKTFLVEKNYLKASRSLAPKITAIFGDASEIVNSYRNEW